MVRSDRLLLKVLGPEAASDVMQYLLRNREHFRNAGPKVTDDYFTISYQRLRLSKEADLVSQGIFLRFYLFLRDDAGGPIGDISISQIARGIMQSCVLGYKIDRDHTGRGLMTEAVDGTVKLAFTQLGLHRVEANIMPSNIASQRVVEKLGFEREGYSRRFLKIDGDWQDHVRYAKLGDE
jgi:[ribosomal protein S5]-alanine N-acetyltransferase